MNKARTHGNSNAFTLLEFMVIIVAITVLALLLVPSLSKAKQQAQRIRCTSFLKQTGLSFRQWGIDHTNLFPMQVSAEFGGTKESITRGETFRHFEVMSNYLNTPLILACPADNERAPMRSFAPDIGNSNVSYFVGLDADETCPSSHTDNNTLECGDLSPLCPLDRLVGQAEPRSAARRYSTRAFL